MKKLILIITLATFFGLNAQEVSPYYPAKNKVNDPYYFTSQITYFDLNYISNNISEFLTYRLNMVVEKDDDTKAYWDKEVTTGRLKRAFIDLSPRVTSTLTSEVFSR